ncbi:MAG: tetratricopeptide repeat protein [Thermodesulfovibrionales bacterium]|nr:tetratricopeptide repeat protein [Thermodesulfovibrionales bacterium]
MIKISKVVITLFFIAIFTTFILISCEKPQPKQETPPSPPPQQAQQPTTSPQQPQQQAPQPQSVGTPPAQLGKGSTDPLAQAEIPTEAKLNMQQGINYMRGKDWDNAIKEFTLAIQKHPAYDVAYSNRAVAYMQQKKFNKALDDLKEAEKINPKNATVHYNFVALYSLQNQLDRALDSLDRCLELGFNNYDALRSDPDLNNVRRHPEFRKILEKHKIFIK